MAANWSGGRWRADSFPSQVPDFEPPWSGISSLSPVVSTMARSSPPSWPGTQWLSVGNQQETLLLQETSMLLLPFQLQILPCFVNIELHF